MTILAFPSVDTAGPEGLLAIGGDLEVGSLKLAYESGIFPWPNEGLPLLWFAPPRRGILDFKDFKPPKRILRDLKKMPWSYAIDRDFPRVIRHCSEGRTRVSGGTWITPPMERAYIAFHRAGFAHSFECYDEYGEMIGGLYGVSLGSMFAGESMFFHASGASKAALIFTVEELKKRGVGWMDTQMVSPLLKTFGGRELSRAAFMKRLAVALKNPDIF